MSFSASEYNTTDFPVYYQNKDNAFDTVSQPLQSLVRLSYHCSNADRRSYRRIHILPPPQTVLLLRVSLLNSLAMT